MDATLLDSPPAWVVKNQKGGSAATDVAPYADTSADEKTTAAHPPWVSPTPTPPSTSLAADVTRLTGLLSARLKRWLPGRKQPTAHQDPAPPDVDAPTPQAPSTPPAVLSAEGVAFETTIEIIRLLATESDPKKAHAMLSRMIPRYITVTHQDAAGLTLLDHAAREGATGAAVCLVRMGADPVRRAPDNLRPIDRDRAVDCALRAAGLMEEKPQ